MGVEVGGQGDVAVLGEAAGDAADVVVEAPGLVQHHHGRVETWLLGKREGGAQRLPVGQRDADVGVEGGRHG